MAIGTAAAIITSMAIGTGVSLITSRKQKKALEGQANLTRAEKQKIIDKGKEIAGRKMVYLPQGTRPTPKTATGTGVPFKGLPIEK